MYYFCRQNLFEQNQIIEITGHTEVTGAYLWTAGQKFPEPVPRQTLMLNAEYGTNFPAFFDTTIPVMSDELIQAFRDAGIDNFDAYPMILKRQDTGEEYSNYKAVNFIGAIDCIDMDESVFKLNKRGKPRNFRSITINESKTQGAKAFRLAVGPDLLVVNEEVAEKLKPYNFLALLLQKTTDFDGD
jgi:hypothetical protein